MKIIAFFAASPKISPKKGLQVHGLKWLSFTTALMSAQPESGGGRRSLGVVNT